MLSKLGSDPNTVKTLDGSMNDILGEKFVDACVRRPFVEHMVCKRTNTTEIIKMRF